MWPQRSAAEVRRLQRLAHKQKQSRIELLERREMMAADTAAPTENYGALAEAALVAPASWTAAAGGRQSTIDAAAGGLLAPSRFGDFNADGRVDAADYTVYRDTLGSTTDQRADATGDGRVDELDRQVWVAHYGQSTDAAYAAAIGEVLGKAADDLAVGLAELDGVALQALAAAVEAMALPGGASLSDDLDLVGAIAAAMPRLDFNRADSLAALTAALEAGGFTIEFTASQADLERSYLGERVDLVQFRLSIELPELIGSTTLELGGIDEVLRAAGIETGGDGALSGAFLIDLLLGVDTEGLYLLGGSSVDGEVRIGLDSSLVTPGVSGGAELSVVVAATATLGGGVERARVRRHGVSTRFVTTTTGEAVLALDGRLSNSGVNSAPVRGSWKWLLGPGGDLTLDEAVSGFDQAVLSDSLVDAALVGIASFAARSGALADRLSNLPVVGEDLRTAVKEAIDSQLTTGGAAAGGDRLASLGFELVSVVSVERLLESLRGGGASAEDLVVIRYLGSRDKRVSLDAGGAESLGVGAASLEANFSGSMAGDARIAADLTFGIDLQGRAFVMEGGTISATVDVAGVLRGSASAGPVNGALTAEASVEAAFALLVNDGDSTPDERLYFDSADLDAAISNPGAVTVTGGFDLDSFELSASVPALAALLPTVTLTGRGGWGLRDGVAQIRFDDDALLDALAEHLAGGVNQLADQAGRLAAAASNVPVIGGALADPLTDVIDSALRVNLPADGVRDYLESRGFVIQSLLTAEQLLLGRFDDLLIVRYDRDVVADPIVIDPSGTLGDARGIHLDLAGHVVVRPSLSLDFTFGLDTTGGLFVLEGSHGEAALTVDATGPDGSLLATAVIPGLTTVTGTARAMEGRHLVEGGVSLLLSDFDQTPGERLYVFGGSDLRDALSHEDAIDFTGKASVEATLALDNPLNFLPGFLRDQVNGLVGLPEQIAWTAGIHYDAETGQLDYTIENNSLTAIVEAFQSSDGFEDALFNLMLDRFEQNNPIPADVQAFLGAKIPLIEKNLLDLLEVPQAVQYLIAPAAFRDRGPVAVEEGDSIRINLDLFTPENLARLLSGQTYDILSVDVDQRFEQGLGSITVLPETVVFSYLGVVNATVELVVEPGFFFEVDLKMGIDSEDFYVVGALPGAGVDAAQLKAGGSLVARGVAEADLLFLIDFARITIGLGFEAFGGVTLVTLDPADPKVRFDQITPETIEVGLGVDAIMDFTGEVGLVDTSFKATVEADTRIPVYRSEPGTSIADLQRRIDKFKEDMKTEGRKKVFLAAAAGEPHAVLAAAYILYQDNRDLIATARAMVVDHGIDFIDTLRALTTQLGARAGHIVGVLQDQAGVAVERLGEVVTFLSTELKQGLGTVVQTVWGLTHDLGEVVEGVWGRATNNLGELAGELWRLRSDLKEVVSSLWGRATTSLGDMATVMVRDLNAGLVDMGRVLKNELGASMQEVGGILLHRLSVGLSEVPNLLRQIGWNNLAGLVLEALDAFGNQVRMAWEAGGAYVRELRDQFGEWLSIDKFNAAGAQIGRAWLDGGKWISQQLDGLGKVLQQYDYFGGYGSRLQKWRQWTADGVFTGLEEFNNLGGKIRDGWLSGGKWISQQLDGLGKVLQQYDYFGGYGSQLQKWRQWTADGVFTGLEEFNNLGGKIRDGWLSGGKWISQHLDGLGKVLQQYDYFGGYGSQLQKWRQWTASGVFTGLEEFNSLGGKIRDGWLDGGKWISQQLDGLGKVLQQYDYFGGYGSQLQKWRQWTASGVFTGLEEFNNQGGKIRDAWLSGGRWVSQQLDGLGHVLQQYYYYGGYGSQVAEYARWTAGGVLERLTRWTSSNRLTLDAYISTTGNWVERHYNNGVEYAVRVWNSAGQYLGDQYKNWSDAASKLDPTTKKWWPL